MVPGTTFSLSKSQAIAFGSSLNTHVHFHICVVDGVFEAIGEDDSEVKFHALTHLSADAIAQVQNEAK